MKLFSRLIIGSLIFLILVVLLPIFFIGLSEFNLPYIIDEPMDMGRSGGIAPIIFSTFTITLMSVILTAFIGIPLALCLSGASRSNRWISVSLDLLAGVPSIVFGLFGNAFFCQFLGLGYSLLSGSLTLCLMTLPLFVRLTETAIHEVPKDFLLSARALGLGPQTWTFRILLPMVWPSLTIALILSWTRAIGETAALLLTSGYSMRWPGSVFESGRTLSVHIYDLTMNISGADSMAYKAAFSLMALTAIFISICRFGMKEFLIWRLKSRH